ncbi:hypothetical protein SLINC_3492 [Streptomyces lincolnensis]|uniref:Uncharacterized protein n=1 Tax=Streptomyces lincolnensis TaxID=1915 RepID=A0A1B1MAR0_STRLN|nr:hypothetical protein [Streptomyces lincolnensis]ANS65716.1 hypothetical protein SLINC_3492 [Streptomyces lincolnensis]AXG54522.1 hypothetical protein SLCG_3367 [Streptomyces lincolnensis]QMV08888.1 transcriptional regulator [Streptomyces lincolnensis]
MTTVRTTPAAPPPRLPVRDKASARDRGWGGGSPMLSRLAAERATGVLVRERGTLRLSRGRVVDAESPAAPGLDVLLSARGTLDGEAWRRAVSETGDHHHAGHRLVECGLLAPGALELCRLVALYDAAYFALGPSGVPGRFRYAAEDGPGCGCPVPVAALERETLRRRDLLHRIWPDPATDERPLTRAHRAVPPPATGRQRAVLAELDDVRTAADIARELGRPAFHTLVDLRRLAAAGVVATREPAPAEAPDPFEGIPADATDPHITFDPHITLLKRLRDALEAL